jgi:hypothetical protein
MRVTIENAAPITLSTHFLPDVLSVYEASLYNKQVKYVNETRHSDAIPWTNFPLLT